MPFEELKARQSIVWGSGAYEPIVEITSEIHEALVVALDGRPGQRWLDIGTGTGAVALRTARTGAEVTGVDLAPAFIELARQNDRTAGLLATAPACVMGEARLGRHRPRWQPLKAGRPVPWIPTRWRLSATSTDQRELAALPEGVPMSEVQVNGVRLHYEEHGQGPPILCIHGTGGSALMWSAAVPEFARLGRVIVYDRRGCTRSQRPDPYDTTSVAEHADDAVALLDALGAAPAAVIGRSYGGEIATDLALRYPQRVRGLVLLEGASLGLSAEAAAWEESLRQRVVAAAADDPATVGERFIRAVLGDAAWDGFPAPVKQMFADNGPAILAEVTGGSLHVDQAALASIDQPTLLVAAASSPEAFRQVTDAIATAMPNSRKHTVEGGHLINPADPAVLSFLQELPR